MVIDIIVILKFYLIFLFKNNGGVRIRYPCPITDSVRRTPCIIIQKPHIPLDKLYIIYEPIR